jgi:hypothetical protein
MPSAQQLPTTLFAPISDLPFQRPLLLPPYAGTPSEGLPFPAAVQVAQEQLKTVDEVVEAVEKFAEAGEVTELLKKHGGALLIRGTHAEGPEDFSRIVHALKLGKPHAEVRSSSFALSSFRLLVAYGCSFARTARQPCHPQSSRQVRAPAAINLVFY